MRKRFSIWPPDFIMNRILHEVSGSLCIVLLVSACQFRVPKDPYTLIQNLGSEPDVLNAVLWTSQSENIIVSTIYEPLIGLDNETLAFKPVLAERWEVSPDHRQYTFYLRHDVKWHDGTPLTADDVVYTMEKIMDPKVDAGPIRSSYVDVLKTEKLDDYTVRFTYRIPYFRALVVLGGLQIIPKHVFNDGTDFNQHPANRAPVGTGPYRFVRWKTGRYLQLERFENYWGKKPDIRRLQFRIIPSGAVALQLLKKGELDRMDLGTLMWVKQTKTPAFEKNFTRHRYPTVADGYTFMGWNLQRAPFDDKKVRQAMAYLLDLPEMAQKMFFDLWMPATGPAAPQTKDSDATLSVRPYDPQKAKKLLAEAGWLDHDGDGWLDKSGQRFHFALLSPAGSVPYEKIISVFRQNLRAIGIDVELRQLEWVAFTREIDQHQFDAVILTYTRAYPTDLYQIWHSSQIKGGSNFVGFNNFQVDRLLEQARQEFDDAKRAGLNREMHRILYDEQPYFFLFNTMAMEAVHNRFQNVKEYLVGMDIVEWKVATP